MLILTLECSVSVLARNRQVSEKGERETEEETPLDAICLG